MQGEPLKLFNASKAGTPENIKEFFDARYLKIAQALRSTDRATNAVGEITRNYLKLRKSLHDMAETGKDKIQILHNDADFKEADRRYITARDTTHGIIGNQLIAATRSTKNAVGHIAREKAKRADAPVANDMLYVKQAADLIYDIVLTRDPRDQGSVELKLAVEGREMPSVRRH